MFSYIPVWEWDQGPGPRARNTAPTVANRCDRSPEEEATGYNLLLGATYSSEMGHRHGEHVAGNREEFLEMKR